MGHYDKQREEWYDQMERDRQARQHKEEQAMSHNLPDGLNGFENDIRSPTYTGGWEDDEGEVQALISFDQSDINNLQKLVEVGVDPDGVLSHIIKQCNEKLGKAA